MSERASQVGGMVCLVDEREEPQLLIRPSSQRQATRLERRSWLDPLPPFSLERNQWLPVISWVTSPFGH